MIKSADLTGAVNEYCATVFGTCRRNTPNVEAAWEAYQDTFLVLVRKQQALDPDSDWGPWLRETARRCSQAVSRREQRVSAVGLEAVEQELFSLNKTVADTVEWREISDILKEEFQQLEAEDQQILELVYKQEKSHREIADVVNCPAGSVHAKVDSARDRLKNRLKRRGVALGAALLVFLFHESAKAGSFVSANGENENQLEESDAIDEKTSSLLVSIGSLSGLAAIILATAGILVGYGIVSDKAAAVKTDPETGQPVPSVFINENPRPWQD